MDDRTQNPIFSFSYQNRKILYKDRGLKYNHAPFTGYIEGTSSNKIEITHEKYMKTHDTKLK